MRVVVVSPVPADPEMRGVWRALAGSGSSVALAVPDHRLVEGRRERVAWGEDGGLRIAPIAVAGDLRSPEALRWQGRALRRLLTDFRPDVVHVHAEAWSPLAATALAVAQRLRVPAVLHVQESRPRTLSWRLRLRRARTLRRAAALAAVNRVALDLAASARPGVPGAVIPRDGIAPPLLPAVEPRAELAVGFVGRIVPERGLDLLLRAGAQLGRGWTLDVAGTGPSQEELEALAQRLGISARITWHGGLPRRALRELWERLDVLVVPSRSTDAWIEPVGSQALDAMAHGVAVVATGSGALPDVVGDAGVLVPENDIAALAAALDGLRTDPGRRAAVAAAGRRRALAEFTHDAVARRLGELWRTVRRPEGGNAAGTTT